MDFGYIVHITIASARRLLLLFFFFFFFFFSSPTRGTCEKRQVLLAGVPGDFTRGFSPVCAPPSDWPVSYGLKLLERDLKWIKDAR